MKKKSHLLGVLDTKGFTLIELLVVVLIIGILAAVALPQYQKAVWKSRASQLFAATRSLATAQEAYHLANNTYADSFGELDLDFDSLSPATTPDTGGSVNSTDAVRQNNMFELIINKSTSAGFALSLAKFKQGDYRGAGFIFIHYDPDGDLGQTIYCVEHTYTGTAGGFCKKLWGCTGTPVSKWNARYYEMP